MCSLRCVLGPEFRRGAKFQGPKFLSLCVSPLHVATSLTLRPRKLLCRITFFVLIPSNEAVLGNVSHYFGEIKLSAPKNAIMKNEGEGGASPASLHPSSASVPSPLQLGPWPCSGAPSPGLGGGQGGPQNPPPPPQAQGGPILGTSGHGGGARTERGGAKAVRGGAKTRRGVARSARGRGL